MPSPSLLRDSMFPFFLNIHHTIGLPLPQKKLVESQPVRAWTTGIDSENSEPNFLAMSSSGVYLTRSITPVVNQSSVLFV